MAIQIINHPDEIAWSRNSMLFELQTDNLYSIVGTYPKITIKLSRLLEVGEGFKFMWGQIISGYDFERLYLIKSAPTAPTDLRPYQPGMSVEDFVEQVAEDLRCDNFLYEYYQINAVGDSLEITARQKNVFYNIACQDFTLGSLVIVPENSPGNETRNENFAVLAELLVSEDGYRYSSFTKSIIEPEDNGKIYWDISQYITSYLNNKVKRIDDLTGSTEVDTSGRVFYFLRLTEMYGSPPTLHATTESGKYVAVLGGVPKSTTVNYFDAVMPKWFVNWSKQVYSGQIEYLSIYNFGTDRTGVNIRSRLYGKYNTIRELTLGTITSWKRYDKLICPINIGALLEELDSLTDLEVWLEEGGYRISDKVSMKVDNTFHPTAQILLFRNSIGVYETLYTYGKREYAYDIDKKSEVFEPIINNRDKQSGHRKEFDIELIDEYRINTGYFSKGVISKFRDFFLSMEKYILKNGVWHPVLLDSSSIQEYEDGKYLYGLTFTLKSANEQVIWG